MLLFKIFFFVTNLFFDLVIKFEVIHGIYAARTEKVAHFVCISNDILLILPLTVILRRHKFRYKAPSMKYLPMLFTLSIFLLMGCASESQSTNYQEIDIVTGLNLFDENGAPLGRLALPNDKKGDAAVYPIPAIDVVFVEVQAGSIDTIYIVPATCADDGVPQDVPLQLEDITYTRAELEAATGNDPAHIYSWQSGVQRTAIDVSAKLAGFHRVFMRKADGQLLWYNTYIDPNVTNYADFSFYDMECQ